ncbi:MAG TPA: type IX secretion system membrane protein PorP/SprF [Anditalea sp.]|nr:type IX secretion system membrane protein PorP/SprF [Anditalea sp.]
MKKLLIILCCCFLGIKSFAQDIQFSQFYASPLYLNPAFAGSTDYSRVGVNYRNQWPGLDHSFNSFSAYGDMYIDDKNSGLGIIINGSRESLANLQNMEVGLLYSYRVRLGAARYLQVGAQGSFISRSGNFDKIILSSQLDIDRGTIIGGGNGVAGEPMRRFADLNTGLLYYSEKIWIGASAHHLTQPNVSFIEGQDRLAIKYSLHGGIKFDLQPGLINDFVNNTQQERTISFAFNYKQQGPFDQLNIGTEFYLEPLVLGLWYRGLPSKNALPNNEALIGLLGFSFVNGLDIGYSYDFTISKLGWGNTGGAHELSMRYLFITPEELKKKRSVLPSLRF